MTVRREDITVEYQNGKKIVYMSPNATPTLGGSAIDDYKVLRAVADEVGAGVRDPYNKLIPRLVDDKRLAEKTIELIGPSQISPKEPDDISYIHHKHSNLLGSVYYHGAVEDDLRRARAHREYEDQRYLRTSQVCHELFEVESALSDLKFK